MTSPNSLLCSNQHQQPTPATPKSKHAGVQQRHQAAFIQRFIYDALVALRQASTDKETGQVTMDVKTAVAVHKLAGGWNIISDRRRILGGKGLPAAVKSRIKAPASVEPLDPA